MTSRGKDDNSAEIEPCAAPVGRHGHRHGCCQCGDVDAVVKPVASAGPDEVSSSGAVSLATLKAGQRGRLYCIDAGRSLCGRLTSMGLAPGMVIEVIRRQGAGQMVICAHRTRLALGRGIIEKIMVHPVAVTVDDKAALKPKACDDGPAASQAAGS